MSCPDIQNLEISARNFPIHDFLSLLSKHSNLETVKCPLGVWKRMAGAWDKLIEQT
jgi:hypothetical protein